MLEWGDFMEKCNIIDSCFFINAQLIDLPHTKECFWNEYCKGNFNECAHHKLYAEYFPFL
jgi:hypothetical protein